MKMRWRSADVRGVLRKVTEVTFWKLKCFTCKIQSCCLPTGTFGLSGVISTHFLLCVNEDALSDTTYCCPAALGQGTWPQAAVCPAAEDWPASSLNKLQEMKILMCFPSNLRWFEAYKIVHLTWLKPHLTYRRSSEKMPFFKTWDNLCISPILHFSTAAACSCCSFKMNEKCK